MKALVKTAPGKNTLELRDIPKPVATPGHLLVKVMAAGVCGTDIHIQDDEYPCTPPRVIGHEYTGIIEEIGEGVTGWNIGDQVVSFNMPYTCGSCRYCRQGYYMLCDNRKGMGGSVDGCMAEYIAIPADTAFKVPESAKGSDIWAIAEPAACCLRAVIEQSTVNAGDVVLVTGPGTMGLFCMQMAQLQGAQVIMAGTAVDKERLELAKKLGAIAVCDDPSKLKEIVEAHAPGGVNVSIECSGTYPGYESCVTNTRKRGHVALVGVYGKAGEAFTDELLYRELKVTTNYASEYSSWDRLMKLVAQGKVHFDELVSHRLPLEQWEEGFRLHREKGGLKVLLIP